MSKIIVMLGAPGSGKGTQAKQLESKFSIPQISTGDILRTMSKEESSLGLEIRQTQAAGKLVSDNILINVVKERTAKQDCQKGFILDGYPRTLVQAEQLEKLAAQEKKEVIVINIDVLDELLLKRLTGRRNCSSCGDIYNIYFKPPKINGICDNCNQTLIHRSDDNVSSIEKRLQEYHKNTSPLINYYQALNLLSTIDGSQSAEGVFNQLCTILGKFL